MNKIELTLEFLNRMFDESDYMSKHPESKKYRLEHSLRVANIGKEIAIAEGFDVDAMVVACLLHDISYCNEFQSEEEWLNHGRVSAKISREFVKTLEFNKKTEDDILYGIAIHVDDSADFEGEKTPFTLCIGDADNIDRFDVYRIFETLKNDKFDELLFEQQYEICKNRIEKMEKYLKINFATPTSTNLLHERILFQIQFYSKLKSQLENSKKIISK